jgi:uncharacterized membrane protein
MPAKLRFILYLSLFFLILSQCTVVQASTVLKYTIEVQADGSATWIVEQRGTDVQPSLNAFSDNVSILVGAAKKKTQRNMSAESFFMSVNVSGSYKIVKYRFVWKGFSEVEDGRIAVGDVFTVSDFFSYFYGDGEVHIFYPSTYDVESVSPQPSVRNDSVQMMEWFGTLDFGVGKPKVTFEERLSPSFVDIVSKNAVLILSLLATLSAGLLGLYYFRFWRKRLKKEAGVPGPVLSGLDFIEGDEEKVVYLLRASGGRLHQSKIVDQCEFSRSKTSHLLKIMEDGGKIRRENKGREKIVFLLENQG